MYDVILNKVFWNFISNSTEFMGVGSGGQGVRGTPGFSYMVQI